MNRLEKLKEHRAKLTNDIADIERQVRDERLIQSIRGQANQILHNKTMGSVGHGEITTVVLYYLLEDSVSSELKHRFTTAHGNWANMIELMNADLTSAETQFTLCVEWQIPETRILRKYVRKAIEEINKVCDANEKRAKMQDRRTEEIKSNVRAGKQFKVIRN